MTDRDLIRRQLDLEEEAHTLGAARYRQQRPLPWRTDTSAEEEEANLPPGRQLIKLAVEPTAELIREKVETAQTGKAGRRFAALKWLEEASPEEVAYLAARVAITGAVRRMTFQTVATQLGSAIIDHVEMMLFASKNKAGYVGLIRANSGRQSRGAKKRREAIRKLLEKEDAKILIPRAEKLHLGSFALETLIEATGLFTLDLEPRGRDKFYVIRPTEAVEQWLERQHGRCELLDPMWMPMIVRPKRWRTPTVGGYLSSRIGPSGRYLVKPPGKMWGDGHSLNRDYIAQLRALDLSEVYEAVNHVQETAWAINPGVLEVVREIWDTGGSLAGLPPRDDLPLPPRKEGIENDEEALRAWKRSAVETHETNARNRSARLGVQQRLWMAERFAKEDAFWFPHSMDFRGRLYPIPNSGFSPQSDDLGKALLRFAEGKPLGDSGAFWLAVHIANLFGVDKVSLADRVQWTYDNAGAIIDSAVQPLDGARFWTTAESPWMALAAAIEFAGYLEEGPGYVSHLPIPLDGSNSGLQHFSAMLRDPEGGAAVNLIPSEIPQDVYDRVASKAHDIVTNSEDEAVKVWAGKITRRITKRPTMTYVYSATRFGMHEMIFDTLRELDEENAAAGLGPYLGEGADNYAAAKELSYVLYGAIGDVVSAAQGAMGWLRDVARIAANAGHSLEWTTPDGLLVRQSYRNVYANRIRVHWQARQLQITLNVTGSSLDARGQANGISPNFVHSLDAAHLRAVARAAKAEGINSLAVIHDSFGTHAADTDKLVRLLRDTFVSQYEDRDVLQEFYDEARAQLPEEWARELPPPPEKGDMDLGRVRFSTYLFA